MPNSYPSSYCPSSYCPTPALLSHPMPPHSVPLLLYQACVTDIHTKPKLYHTKINRRKTDTDARSIRESAVRGKPSQTGSSRKAPAEPAWQTPVMRPCKLRTKLMALLLAKATPYHRATGSQSFIGFCAFLVRSSNQKARPFAAAEQYPWHVKIQSK